MSADLLGFLGVLALVVIAIAFVALLIGAFRFAREAYRLTAALNERVTRLDTLADELSATLVDARETMAEARATLAPLRSSAEATEDIVRVPGEVVTRAARVLKGVGEGLADQATRLRRTD
jgi:ABC-type transporter Mla subunit MlaD